MTTGLKRNIVLLSIAFVTMLALTSGSAAASPGAVIAEEYLPNDGQLAPAPGAPGPGLDDAPDRERDRSPQRPEPQVVEITAPNTVTTGDPIPVRLKTDGEAEGVLRGTIQTSEEERTVRKHVSMHKYDDVHIPTHGVGEADGVADLRFEPEYGPTKRVTVDLEAPSPPWWVRFGWF